jgi:hypothetical protein
MITHVVKRLNVEIGDHPDYHDNDKQSFKKYDAIINVSDCPAYGLNDPEFNVHWYPIEEWEKWGYAPFYWAVHLFDFYTKQDKNLYVHCYAGKHRSPMIVYLYLQSLGYSEEEAFGMFDSKWQIRFDHAPEKPAGNWLKKFLDKDIAGGRIPADIVEFMKNARKYPDKSILHIVDMMKLREDDISDKEMHISFSEPE